MVAHLLRCLRPWAVAGWGVAAVVVWGADVAADVGALRLIGVRALPAKAVARGEVVGGLSGIDYDPAADRWLAVSDDKAEFGPARFFTVRLDYDASAFRAVTIEGVTVLRQQDGSLYPDKPHFKADRRGDVPDIEALRLDPRDGSIWYASEGDRALGLDPFVRRAGRDGAFLSAVLLPPGHAFAPDGRPGVRPNLSIEGIAFTTDGKGVWLALEAPGFGDGPVASERAGALTRFTRIDRQGTRLAQFAYPLDPWRLQPAPDRLADNGVGEILAQPDGGLLVLERSGAQDAAGAWHYAVRLYAADFSAATEVSAVPSLAAAPVRPAAKRLVFEFKAPDGRPVDNLEGLAWGRRLPNGHATLVVVSDDNFSRAQETQFWVFEVLPFSP